MKPLQTAIVIIVAMLIGAAITYWAVRQLPPAGGPPPKAGSSNLSTAALPAVAGSDAVDSRPVPKGAALDEQALDAAINEAKAARARGELKPAATTPEGYARELGLFNYRLVELTTAFPDRPEDGTRDAKVYAARIDQLTRQYANLSLDEELLTGTRDDTPEQLAHLQAHLAAGSLELDEAGTAKLEEILRETYAKTFPLDDKDPGAAAKFESATKEITESIMQFLTPEQKKRFGLMGADKVLFGLPEQEP